MRGGGTASGAGDPSPRRRGPARIRPVPGWTAARRGGDREEESRREREKAQGERGRRCTVRRRGKRQLSAAAGGVHPGDRFRSRRRLSGAGLPCPEGAGVRHPGPADWGAPGPAVPGCASAPRSWLRAGGGRTTRKSCASAASLGARAAPGAVRSRATRPQVRGRGGAGASGLGGGHRQTERAGRFGTAQVLPGRRLLPRRSGWDRHL